MSSLSSRREVVVRGIQPCITKRSTTQVSTGASTTVMRMASHRTLAQQQQVRGQQQAGTGGSIMASQRSQQQQVRGQQQAGTGASMTMASQRTRAQQQQVRGQQQGLLPASRPARSPVQGLEKGPYIKCLHLQNKLCAHHENR